MKYPLRPLLVIAFLLASFSLAAAGSYSLRRTSHLSWHTGTYEPHHSHQSPAEPATAPVPSHPARSPQVRLVSTGFSAAGNAVQPQANRGPHSANIGPVPYISEGQSSPFVESLASGTTELEDFEDGALNLPGVTASAGSVQGPGPLTDSVDGDDGLLDGSGIGGHSFFSSSGATGIDFIFSPDSGGNLPLRAGIVWTDGSGAATFQAFDAAGALITNITADTSDHAIDGGTSEDRFYGTTYPPGIKRIKISNAGGGIEVDHLQIGYTPQVAIVESFASAETTALRGYVTDLGYGSTLISQGNLTLNSGLGFDLVIWDELGFRIGGTTDLEVDLFNQLAQAGVPLYLIGDDLAFEQADLSPPEAALWRQLTHFEPTVTNGNSRNDVQIVNTTHPVMNGPFGTVQDFTYNLDMDGTTRTNTGETLLAQSGTFPVAVAATGNAPYRYLTQLFNATDGTLAEQEKLFKNAVVWLVQRDPVTPPIVVTIAGDIVDGTDGETSLREAITRANSRAGAQTIAFQISSGAQVIAPATPLPNLTDNGTVIDGTTQPGYAGTPLITIAPTGTGQTTGLIINGSNCEIRGLALNANFTNIRIRGANASNNTIRDCYIGVNPAGTGTVACFKGIDLAAGASNNHIGVSGGGNVISGNDIGVSISDSGTTGNLIQSNLIGTDASGTGVFPNQRGVWIQNGANNNAIGSNSVGLGNLISGNSFNGIDISGAGSDSNRVLGNVIGLSSAGLPLGNGTFGSGIVIEAGAKSNRVGGTSTGARNVISGHTTGTGITIDGVGTNRNLVQGNYIGLNAGGDTAIANNDGVHIQNGAKNNIIGGTTAGHRNVISGCQFGVGISNPTSTGNQIQGNYIGTDATGTQPISNDFGVGIDDAADNTIGGNGGGTRNLISGNVNANVYFAGGTGNVVAGNFIGTDRSGDTPLGLLTTTAGVWLDNGANANIIGGNQPGERNVISGHAGSGVLIQGRGSGTGALSFGNIVKGNYIGTNKGGTGPVPNQGHGVIIDDGAHDNVIGGVVASARNLISGNVQRGVIIEDTGTDNNRVRGNYVGTNIIGSGAIPNQFDGISVFGGASNNTIGGSVTGAGNVVSGNLVSGISIEEDNTSGNTVQGNRVGLAANSNTALPNTRGSQIGWGVIVISADQTLIGGPGLAANVIAHNEGPGVAVQSSRGPALRTEIRGNRIFQNGGLGIDLDDNGVTPNDTGDGDTGTNSLQNYPVITSASVTGGNTVIGGTFNSRPSRSYHLEFFSSAAADPSGFGEGNRFIGAQTATTDGSGNASFTASFTGSFPGPVYTATATDASTGETSEFSAAFTASTAILHLTLPTSLQEGNTSTFTGTVMRSGVSTASSLLVDLSASPTSQLNLPVSVLIPADFASQTFSFTVVNDTVAESSPLPVTVTASASGFTDGTAVVNVTDDDSGGGQLFAWGYNEFGQVGDGSNTNRALPIPISLGNVRSISGNGSHSLAVLADGTMRAWGYNGGGQLGDGSQTDRTRPVPVSGLTNVSTVAAGWYHSLALKGDGTVWAWGFNKFGQVGDGSTVRRLIPVRVAGLTNVRAIAAGIYFSLAVKSDGTVWAWGNNFYGQLGDGSHSTSLVPRQIPGLTGVVDVAAGAGHSLFLKSDGTVWASGWNTYGQLGNESLTDSAVPTLCPGLNGATHISAGYAHSLAVNGSGVVFGWGDNSYAQLGSSIFRLVSSPVSLPGLTGVVDVEAGASFSLFLSNSGTLRALGNNGFGQLGIGTPGGNVSSPVPISSLSLVGRAAAGYGHALAIGSGDQGMRTSPSGSVF